jgi:nucleotidyltransferase/DNA polymerase involved in DNA repair
MKPSHQTMTHLYEHLGKVFYCIAAIDKTIRKEEIAQLKEIVKTEWLPLENTFNEFGDDTAYEIEIVFDWLIANTWNTEQVIPDFKIFRKEHDHLFTPEVIILILKTANAIANSFLEKNKSEHVFISQLSAILIQ